MMTRERELLQQALDALDRAISDDRAYIRECKDAAEAIRAHLAAQPAPAEDFCYCDDDISLQMVSGGAALEGLYGRVTLKINGQYVDYVKAEPAPAEHVAWCKYEQRHERPTRIVLCDSDEDGAFRVYAAPPAAQPAPTVPNGCEKIFTHKWLDPDCIERGCKSLAAPPAAPAVPLTDGRITAIANELAYAGGLCNVYEFARAIEQAHGIAASPEQPK